MSTIIENEHLARLVVERFESSGRGASRHGGVLALDGPDCSGKTSLADAICRLDEDAWRVLHIDDLVSSEILAADREVFSLQSFMLEYFPVEECAEAITRESHAALEEGRFLVVEGLFLARPALRDCVNYLVRLEVPPSVVVRRALARDVGVLGDADWVRRHYETQCLPAQAIYRTFVAPAFLADLHLELRHDERSWIVSGEGGTR